VTQAATIMKQQDVGSVPVVESQASKRLVGIVTDRDLVVKVLAAGRRAEQATVKDAMTPNPVSCRDTDDVSHVMDLMKERQVRRMPIVDGKGCLMGIIAQADVATRIHQDEQTGDLVEAISESGTRRR
jgi:CBS domain-containing protein